MKIPAARVEGFAKAPDPKARAVLVFGPDGGLVRERIERLVRSVVSDPKDPFRVAALTFAALKADPTRLADEAAAIALTGGRRVVVIRDAADGLTSLFQTFLSAPKGDALLVVEAGELSARSSLRRLFETADNAAALACYADEGHGLQHVIQEELKSRGLTARPDALSFLVDHLGADRRLTRSEIQKLALYMLNPGGEPVSQVRLEDAVACVGDTSALSMDALANAVADGDHANVQNILDRLFGEGTHAVGILRMVARHFLRLHLVAGALAKGKSKDQAMLLLKPPVIYRAADAFRRQLGLWPVERLGEAISILTEAEGDCKTTGMPTQEICARALLRLAGAASRRGAR